MRSADGLPRYSEIEAQLRARISRLRPGDALPSDAMLCEEFGVSRMTARAAVQRLVQDGLVTRVAGRGTFVAGDPDASPESELDRVSAILAILTESDATATRLARLLGRTVGEVETLLARMASLEFVERAPGGRTFRLGLRMFRLGSAVIARFDERQAALPVMEDIHHETEQTVYLCVRRGDEAVCIERIEGLWVRSMALKLGGSLPLHAGAAPRALLAAEPRAAWEEYLNRGPLEAWTPSTPITRDAVLHELESTSENGYALSDGDVVPDIASLGAAVFGHRGRVCAAISVGGPRQAILGENVERNVQLVVDGASRISHALGHSAVAAS